MACSPSRLLPPVQLTLARPQVLESGYEQGAERFAEGEREGSRDSSRFSAVAE